MVFLSTKSLNLVNSNQATYLLKQEDYTFYAN